MVGQPDPQDEFQAKFSAPYALALVLAGHDVERAPLPARLLADPDVRRWIPLIRVEGNSEFRRRRARHANAERRNARIGRRALPQSRRRRGMGALRARVLDYLGERGAILERAVDRCASLPSVAELMPLIRAAIGR